MIIHHIFSIGEILPTSLLPMVSTVDTKAQDEYSSVTVAKRRSPSKECVESQAKGSAELVKRMLANHKAILNPSQ